MLSDKKCSSLSIFLQKCHYFVTRRTAKTAEIPLLATFENKTVVYDFKAEMGRRRG